MTVAHGPIFALARRLLPGLRVLTAKSGESTILVARFERGDGDFTQLNARTELELAEKLAAVMRARGVPIEHEEAFARTDDVVEREILALAAQGFTEHADTLARELVASRAAQAPGALPAPFNAQGDPLIDGWRVSRAPKHSTSVAEAGQTTDRSFRPRRGGW